MHPRTTPKDSSAFSGATLYGTYVGSLAICLVGNLFLRIGARSGFLPSWSAGTIAIASTLPLFFAAVLFWRLLRRDLDEMMQKIALEGLAFALLVYLPIAALYVNLRSAGVWTPRLDPPDLLMTPALLVAIGILIARQRYS